MRAIAPIEVTATNAKQVILSLPQAYLVLEEPLTLYFQVICRNYSAIHCEFTSSILVSGMGRDVPSLSRPVPGFSNDPHICCAAHPSCSYILTSWESVVNYDIIKYIILAVPSIEA